MQSRSQINTLGEIKAICSVQRMVIEEQVERANVRLRGLDGQRDAEVETLTTAQDGWLNAVSGQSFQLTAASFWSVEILRTKDAIERLDDEIDEAKAARQDLFKAQAAASARCDAIEDLRHSARRVAQRKREEAALDQHAIRVGIQRRPA